MVRARHEESRLPGVGPGQAARYQLAVEFRNKMWIEPERDQQRTLGYKPEELLEWVPRIERLAENAERTQVLMNNCYSDDAVVGARQLTALLHGEDPEAAVAPGR